jgi:hypothetical protein
MMVWIAMGQRAGRTFIRMKWQLGKVLIAIAVTIHTWLDGWKRGHR